MISYLTKSDASEGFNQVINFLNGGYIKYALTDNDVTRLQALVDKKKVVVTEAAIREVLRLDDAEGVDCLLNEEIFAELARMEALDACAALTKRVEHLEYDKVAQALEITKLKRRVKKLEKENMGMMIDDLDKDDVVALMNDKEENKKEKEAKVVEDDQVQGRQAESQAKIYKIDMDHASKVLSMQEDKPAEVQEVVDVVTTANLITEVVTAASETVTATSCF
nr:hypothetical protein [Tanacetum cinerariifolium]